MLMGQSPPLANWDLKAILKSCRDTEICGTQILAEMDEEEQAAEAGAEVSAEVSSTMKPSPSALMLAAGLATAQTTLRDRGGSSAGADDLHCAPSTELQAGYPLAPPTFLAGA